MIASTLRTLAGLALSLAGATALADAPRPLEGARLSAPLRPYELLSTAQRPQLSCPPPTLQQCQSLFWRRSRCGKLAMAAARVDPEAACNLLFSAAAHDYAQQFPAREVVAPMLVGANGAVGAAASLSFADCLPGQGRTCARLPEFSYNGFAATGLEHLAAADALKRSAFMPSSNVSSLAQSFKFQDALRRWGWEQNGNRVESCREYVWEKYYDWSLFELASATSGGEPRVVYDVAYGGIDNLASIGTRAIAGEPLRQRDGTPFDADIPFPTGVVKNAFFETHLAAPPDPEEPGLEMALPCLQRNRVAAFAVALNDPTLEAALRAGPLHNESFAWHKAMNDAIMQAGAIDEELYDLDRRKREFAELLAERRAFEKYFHAWLQSVMNSANDEMLVSNNPVAEIIDPITLAGFLVAADVANVTLPAAGGPGAAFGFLPPPELVGLTPATGVELAAGLAGMAEAICLSQAQSTAEYFMIRFAGFDQRIEQALLEARELGCLDVGNPHSPCDWSPALFASRLAGLFGKEREDNYQTCLDYTANNFAKLNGKQFLVPPSTVVCPAEDFRASPTRVEVYIDCIDAWCAATVAAVEAAIGGKVLDPNTGRLRIGKSVNGGAELGGSVAGAAFSYGSAWQVAGFDINPEAEDASKLSMVMNGSATATVSLFGVSADVLSAGYTMSNEQIAIDFVVLGQDLYPSAVEQQFVASALSPVVDSQSVSATFVEGAVVVPVLVIPVTVRGWITGSAGLSYTATAFRQATPVANQLVALVTPGIAVDAGISASVDAAILEVGVKGKIAILHLDFPIANGLLVGRPAGSADVLLGVTSSADLELTSLSGRVAVFGEIDVGLWSESMEVALFSWSGLRISKNFYQITFDVPVEPLFFISQMAGY